MGGKKKKQKVSEVCNNKKGHHSLYTDDNIAQIVWRTILSTLQILPHLKPRFSVQQECLLSPLYKPTVLKHREV